jgi:hypothetical protein
MELVKITEIKPNPKNPRVIKDSKFDQLKKSIQDFPEMLEKRPLVCFTDTDGKVVELGGNMRLKASKEVGLKELPVILADDWTEEQKAEFLIKDNVGFGEWNWDELANDWDVEKLEDWGLELPGLKEPTEEGEIFFSTELDHQSNYIVLKFNTDIDWIQAQSIFGLQSTYAKRANGKPFSKAIGRVMDGTDAILKIKEG